METSFHRKVKRKGGMENGEGPSPPRSFVRQKSKEDCWPTGHALNVFRKAKLCAREAASEFMDRGKSSQSR